MELPVSELSLNLWENIMATRPKAEIQTEEKNSFRLRTWYLNQADESSHSLKLIEREPIRKLSRFLVGVSIDAYGHQFATETDWTPAIRNTYRISLRQNFPIVNLTGVYYEAKIGDEAVALLGLHPVASSERLQEQDLFVNKVRASLQELGVVEGSLYAA